MKFRRKYIERFLSFGADKVSDGQTDGRTNALTSGFMGYFEWEITYLIRG